MLIACYLIMALCITPPPSDCKRIGFKRVADGSTWETG